MLTTFLLLTLTLANCQPIHETKNEEVLDEITTDATIEHLYRDINVLSYIQNFKNVMAEYITSQYKDLTLHEKEEIKVILEKFLTNFAKDLRMAVENQHRRESGVVNESEVKLELGEVETESDEVKTELGEAKTELEEAKTELSEPKPVIDEAKTELDEEKVELEVNDGVTNETFDEIKNKVRAEFPDLQEVTAKEIVYNLRKNLFETRQKINQLIRGSERAQMLETLY